MDVNAFEVISAKAYGVSLKSYRDGCEREVYKNEVLLTESLKSYRDGCELFKFFIFVVRVIV